MIESRNKSIKSAIVILLMAVLIGCDPYALHGSTPMDLSSFDDIRHYTFDPETILSTLNQGHEKTFQPIPDFTDNNFFPPGTFSWRQQDYLRIANDLNQMAAKDTLEGWNLATMGFLRECSNNPLGFDSTQVIYFKADGDRYTARAIVVFPLKKEADWGGNTDFPHPFLTEWKSIDMENLKVTADDALLIAELNGGKEARLAADNVCQISLDISYNGVENGWWIQYYGDHAATLFEMVIDPYTGLYRVVIGP